MVINKERCKACEICICFCPEHLLELSGEINGKGYHPVMISDQSKCTGCGICALVCPDLVMTVYKTC
ncbi:MAG: 4Fe-4S binding protein [Halanaerobiaceae bacterium]|nr:4Fe-4S binding protein [Halanaerobiaceae bacterium]